MDNDRITSQCPQCRAKLSVNRENAGKQLLCPRCKTVVSVPVANETTAPVAAQNPLWKIAVGTKTAGPFDKARLRAMYDAGKLPQDAFIRDEDSVTDWSEAQTVDWMVEDPAEKSTRYCPECDSRVIIAADTPVIRRRCPECCAPVTFVDYLQFQGIPELDQLPAEPWGKFDLIIFVAAGVAMAAGVFGALSLLWNPVLAVLLGFILVTTGCGLFAVTFHHRSQTSQYRARLPKVELELSRRTEHLRDTLTELNSLKRSLSDVRDRLIQDTQDAFRQQRFELAEQVAAAKDSANAVHRMAQRFLDETRKWWTSKLTGENYQTTKDRLMKAIAFCRKNGYPVTAKHERELIAQLHADYQLVLRRERERSEQARIREQIREEQRVERELKRELERIDTEKRVIERALAEAMKRVGAEHSAEVEALRQKLREAEERGKRAQAQAELTKVGFVYVISNIGSFGENVFKVGLTRRLDPMDRVRELGDASVPFPFDVHMMISSDDAPKLEYTLHKALHRFRVNRVNFRKEFFRVDLDTIRQIVEKNHGVVEYIMDAEALAYKESMTISDEELLSRIAELSQIEDHEEDDDREGRDEMLPVAYE